MPGRAAVTGFGGLAVGADDPTAVQEVSVGAADAWLSALGDCGDGQCAHASADLDDLLGIQGALTWPDDRLQVVAGGGPRCVEQGLEVAELVRSFEYPAR